MSDAVSENHPVENPLAARGEATVAGQGGKKSGIDWRYMLTLMGAAIVSAALVIGYESGLLSQWFQRKPAIVLLNEVQIYQALQHIDPSADKNTQSAQDAARYVGKVIDQTILQYQRSGVAVALNDMIIVVPKKDDITPAVEARIARHFSKNHG